MTPPEDGSSIVPLEYELFGHGTQAMMLAEDLAPSNLNELGESPRPSANVSHMQQKHSGHSLAIPISGRKSPMAAHHKYAVANNPQLRISSGTIPKRLGDDFAAHYSASFSEDNRNSGTSFHGGIPGAPMPSPITSGLAPLHSIFPFPSTAPSTLFPCSHATENSFSPQSPPFSQSPMAVSALKSQSHNVSASPRSFSESMFSFRPGSLSSAEHQLEKQRRRKENHNAVERRRRDMMNILISRLALLVTSSPTGLDPPAANKLNKGEVLEASVQRMLLLNRVAADLAEQMRQLDPGNPVMVGYRDVIASLVTQIPDADIAGADLISPETS